MLAVKTSSLMLIYFVLFAVLSMGANQIILNSYGIVELYYTNIGSGTKFMDWTIVLSQFL